MATTISNTLAAGSTASPYYYDSRLTTTLCKKTCASKSPVFSPTFSLLGYTLVGADQYEAVINVSGIVTYTPCGPCDCSSKSQIVNETFVLPVYSTTAISTISVSGTTISNSVKTQGCANCGNTLVTDCALTISITTT